MSTIFINYRRTDAPGSARHLAENLRACFGADHVFRDYEALEPGDEFKPEIRDAIRGCAVVLVVIGPRWLELRDEQGNRRLDDGDDFVRFEIETALKSEVPVIPVLVEDAAVPLAEDLPPSMKSLMRHNAHELSEKHWQFDMEELINKVERVTELDTLADSRSAAAFPPSPRPSWDVMVRALVNVVPDILMLLGRPKRLLAAKNRGRRQDLLYALTFFFLVVLIADVFLFATWRPEGDSFWGWVFLGVPVWLLVTLLLSVPLWLAWWLVGARRHYVRTIVILFYQIAVVGLMLLLPGTMLIVGLTLRESNAFKEAYNNLMLNGFSLSANQLLEKFGKDFKGPEAFIPGGLALMLFFGLAFWLFASWGAYRGALDKSRTLSFIAFAIFVILTFSPIALFSWLGSQ